MTPRARTGLAPSPKSLVSNREVPDLSTAHKTWAIADYLGKYIIIIIYTITTKRRPSNPLRLPSTSPNPKPLAFTHASHRPQSKIYNASVSKPHNHRTTTATPPKKKELTSHMPHKSPSKNIIVSSHIPPALHVHVPWQAHRRWLKPVSVLLPLEAGNGLVVGLPLLLLLLLLLLLCVAWDSPSTAGGRAVTGCCTGGDCSAWLGVGGVG